MSLIEDVQFGIAAINDPEALGTEGKERLRGVVASLERRLEAIADRPTHGRWRRVGWHYPRCWQTWLDAEGEAECTCWGER